MSHETLNDKEEKQLFLAAKTATDLVAGGMTPDDAVEKVARAEGFGPGKIRTVAHAYNTGRQTSQWREGSTILDKLATFDMVDPEEVIRRIYDGPTTSDKEASDRLHDDYDFPPSWITEDQRLKVASAPLPRIDVTPYQADPMTGLNRAYHSVQRNKQAAEEISRKASDAEDRVRGSVANLVAYFKQASYNRLPFEVVESAAHAYYGTNSAPLMDMVYQQSRLREKRASDRPPLVTKALNLQEMPFTTIRECIKAAEECNKQRQLLQLHHSKAATEKEAAFRPFSKAGASKPQESPLSVPTRLGNPSEKLAAEIFDVPAEKQSGWGTEVAAIATGDILATKATHPAEKDDDPYGDVKEINEDKDRIDRIADKAIKRREKEAFINTPALGAAMGTMLGRTIGSHPKTKDDMVEDAWMDLEDPEHQNELRKIRAHAMLNHMLTDSDDPISGHDHDKVLHAYNEISQLAPRAAENSASLGPLLRRRLEGRTEPFEVKETTDIEKGLAATRQPTPNTQLLGDTPDKLLG